MLVTIRGALAVTVLIAIGACGGEWHPPPLESLQPLGAATCAATGATVRIQLFGDSTQAGSIGYEMAAKTPAVWLQADMDALFGAGKVAVDDRAASSTTSSQLLYGTDGRNSPWPQSVAAEIVVINHGINDAGHGVGIADYKTLLAMLIDASPALVVLETPNPTSRSYIGEFVQAMREVAAERGAPLADTYAYMSGLPGGGTDYLSDWAHPTEELYGHIVRYSLVPTLTPLVRARLCR